MVKKQEIKDLLQKYYNRFYRFQKQEWKKMWREFLILTQNKEIKPTKPIKKRTRMASYDINGNKIEPDEPKNCPKCKIEINEVNTDILIEESNKNYMVRECLECRERIISKIN